MQSVSSAQSEYVRRQQTGPALQLLGPRNRSLLDAIRPGMSIAQKLVITALFVALLALLARARFYLPENPVPITFQTFGVLLAGGILGWRWGLGATIAYYLVGMAGLPVFQGGGHGWHYVTGSVTAGYLLGFILAAGVVGFLSQRGWTHGRSLWPMLLGNLLLYVPALIWLSVFNFGWPEKGALFSSALYPFLPGDLVKLMLASLAVGAGWRYADRRSRS